MKELGARLKEARKKLGITQTDIAKAIGVNPSAINQIERSTTNPSASTIESISTTYKISADWLLTGRGEMFVGSGSVINPTHLLVDHRGMTLEAKGELVEVEIEGIIAAGVPLEQTGDHDLIAPLQLALPNKNQYTALVVHGDSMEPEVRDGDFVLIRRDAEWFHADNKICAVSIDHEHTLKRLQIDASNKMVILHSLNKEYRPMIVDPLDTELRLIGVFAYLLRRFQ